MKCAVGLSIVLACGLSLTLLGQESDPFGPTGLKEKPRDTVSASETVRARQALQTPKSDGLLYDLEQEYVELLKVAENPRKLLEAEQLLKTTNDSSRWTNYSAATRILRDHRDKAAIPLLLRYIVLHAERSSAHVMIPEYAATISAISGHKLASPYVAGPDLPARMRVAVAKIVDDWWSEQSDGLVTRPAEMTRQQLEVLVNDLLRRVRDSGQLSGSGGAKDSAYFVYHVMYYGIMHPGSDELPFKISELHPAMMPVVLHRAGYRTDAGESAKAELNRFRYEAVPLLGTLRKNGFADGLGDVVSDTRQDEVVRMVCLLAMYYAGEPFLTDDLLEILKTTTGIENRMIALSALRVGGPKAVPVLLKHLEDPNIEICTAAACSLRETLPPEALPLIDRRIRSADSGQSVLLLFSALSDYENEPGRRVLAGLVADTLAGKLPRSFLSRAVYAFESACEQDWDKLTGSREASYELQARVALAWYKEHVAEQQQKLQVLTAQVESVETQLEVAETVEKLRHTEYRRLLILQADEVVSAEQAEAAGQSLTQARAETAAHRDSVRELRAQLETLKADLGR